MVKDDCGMLGMDERRLKVWQGQKKAGGVYCTREWDR